VIVALEPALELPYLKLLNEYFAASERNNRASSIDDKKQLMTIKEQMMELCHHNPHKREVLKRIILAAFSKREKTVIISRANSAMSELLEAFALEEEMKDIGVMLLSSELNVHEVTSLIDRFSRSMDAAVLLITDSANPSLNLSAANHLVHYDYPDSDVLLMQRNNRITRQTSYHTEATIYYLMSEGKIDQFNYQMCMNEHGEIKNVML